MINVRISKCKRILGKGYVPNWTEEVLVLKEVKNTVMWIYVIKELNENTVKGF